MRIAINVIQYDFQGTGGTTYAAQLLKNLAHFDTKNNYVILAKNTDGVSWGAAADGRFPVIPFYHPSLRPKSSTAIARRVLFDFGVLGGNALRKVLKTHEVDVVHFTGDRISPHGLGYPTTLTFFGANYWALPSFVYWGNRFAQQLAKRNLTLSLRSAHSILVPSFYVRDILVQLAHVPAEKIKVAYLPSWVTSIAEDISAQGQAEVLDKLKLTRPFFLYASGPILYKNHLRLLQALKLLKRDCKVDIPLVITGRRTRYLDDLVSEIGVEDQVIFTDYISRSELANLYALALAAVHPSLYEAGGSFSMYEAIAIGCPVIYSRIGSVIEILGNHDTTFDPYTPEDIAAKMAAFYRDGALAQQTLKAQQARLMTFSAEETVHQIIAAYELAARSARTHRA